MTRTMSMSPQAVATARRNLVHAIGRFIRRIEGGFQPDVDAMTNLVIALECLEREDYPGGEDAIFLAEKGFAPRRARSAEPRPITELMAHFEKLAAER
jgi:hypothetical protein